MPLDPRIPLMGQPIQLNSPLNMLARAQGIQNMQQTNALNAMQAQDMHNQRTAQQQQAQARAQALANLPPPPQDAPLEWHQMHKAVTAGLVSPKEYFDMVTKADEHVSVAPGSSVVSKRSGKVVASVPDRPEKEPSAVQEYKFAQGQGYRGSFDEWLRTKAQAIHVTATQQVPAPSLTTIVDPADPTKMITVDARAWNPATRSGMVGVSGKEPTAAKREEQASSGKQQVSGVVANLRDMYSQLKAGGGIVDSNDGALSNIQARLSSTGAGQFAGQLVGSKNQKLRDSIEQQRPLLLNAIKNATGMSAKQMDSNVELKLYLSAATDPTKDVAANMEALDNLERLFGEGAQVAPVKPAGGGEPVKVNSIQDAQKLAPGTVFIDPNGVRRVR